MDNSYSGNYFDEEFYATTIETIQDGVFVVKRDKFVLVNQAFLNILGRRRSEVMGSQFQDYVASEYVELVQERYRARLRGENPPNEYEIEILNAKGERLVVQLKVNVFTATDGDECVVCSLRDITLQQMLLNRLKQSESEFRKIIENMPGIFYRTDANGLITMASPYSADILGYDEKEVIGQPLSQFYSEPHQRAEALTKIMQGGGKPVEVESMLRKRDGSTIWVATSAFARYDKDGCFDGVEGISRNITDRKNLEAELREMAVRDQLTGLMNRFGLHEHLETALSRAKRKHNQVSIVYLDLDDFKQVNDQFGHIAGDNYLVEFAKRLIKSFRESDIVARIGGDEFLILLDENTLIDSIDSFLSRLKRIMSEPYHQESQLMEFKYSLGIATFPKHGSDASELLNYADQQMYCSKKL
ncbi:GGDEF domain-containing protein [Aliikangiella sp. G2MR2-5]|uniref:GGDEF domain-containing protein n=1 Tax=Aliikangiella sp. G2MR2-5 TaxID=2788943 RepID=UPI0018AB7F0B|nr:GGDEF domain-containing protein [Aliikangiella sp. G2MR2-5]